MRPAGSRKCMVGCQGIPPWHPTASRGTSQGTPWVPTCSSVFPRDPTGFHGFSRVPTWYPAGISADSLRETFRGISSMELPARFGLPTINHADSTVGSSHEFPRALANFREIPREP